MKLNRTIVIVGSTIAVLLAALVVVGVLILNSMNAPTEEERVAACMEAHGYPLEKTADEIEGFTMEGMREATKACALDN